MNALQSSQVLQAQLTADVAASVEEAESAPRFTEEEQARIDAYRESRFPEELSDLSEIPSGMSVERSERVRPTGAQQSSARSALKSAASNGQTTVPGRYIVKFKDSAFPYALRKDGDNPAERVSTAGKTLNNRAKELVENVGGEIYATWNSALPGCAAELTDEQLEELEASSDVESVSPDFIITACYDQSISLAGLWGLDRIDERNDTKTGTTDESIYRYFNTGSGVHAYVLDTGIFTSHTQFTGRIGTGYYVEGGSVTDTRGHGTHVAGIIGGSDYGVAKGVTLHPVRVSSDGSWTASEAIECMEWIIAQHASSEPAVVNMSFRWYPDWAEFDTSTAIFKAAIDSLISDGVIVVVAAGNEGYDIDTTPCYPAAYSEVITVGATESDDGISSAYNWSSNKGSLVDIWAPGTDILSAGITGNTSVDTKSGTSMAAPYVTGVVARYLEANPTADQSEVETYLKSVASKNKISGDLGGADNDLLFYNGWFYPLHTEDEFVNSDETEDGGYWMWSDAMWSWIWTSYESGNYWFPWFYRASDGAYLYFYDSADDLYLSFMNTSASGTPIETYEE